MIEVNELLERRAKAIETEKIGYTISIFRRAVVAYNIVFEVDEHLTADCRLTTSLLLGYHVLSLCARKFRFQVNSKIYC